MAEGSLYIVSAPSGAGKTSLVRALMEKFEDVAFSVSHTTRPMRPGEVDGRDYHFVDTAEFERMIGADAFLEYARVFDNYYGTARAAVEAQLLTGQDVFLDIDWQGARLIREQWPEAVSIFILPPGRAALAERLSVRGQDDEAVIARRMRDAVNEASHFNEYDYLIINDRFEVALAELEAIVASGRLTRARQAQRYAGLIAELLESRD